MHTCFTLHFKFWRFLFYKKNKFVTTNSHQFFFLVVLHQLLHQLISFFYTFEHHSDFDPEFSFFNGFLKTHTPPQRLKSARRDKSFLSILPNLEPFHPLPYSSSPTPIIKDKRVLSFCGKTVEQRFFIVTFSINMSVFFSYTKNVFF